MFSPERNISHDLATLVLAILLAVALLPPGAAPVAADSSSVAIPSDQSEFHQNWVTEDRGDVATVGVDVGNRSNVTLHVEPENDSASEYTAEVVVYDRNEDGQIAVQLNTYALGHEARPVSATGTDTVHVRASADLDHQLRAGTYRLTLEAGNETVDESTLVVEPASLDGLRVLTANGSQPANLSSRAAVEAAIENGTFNNESHHMASIGELRARFSTRDSLLIELEASGLSGPLASQPGPNTTAKFLNLFGRFDQNGFSLTFVEFDETVGTSEEPAIITPTPAATTVVADPANDTYYVLINPARTPTYDQSGLEENPLVEDGDVFEIGVTVAPSSGIFETEQSLRSQLTYVGWVTAEIPIAVDAAANQTIEIASNLEPHSALRVLLQSDDGWSRDAHTVEVKDDGTIVATFDLSDRSPDETLTLVVDKKYRGLRYRGVNYSQEDAVHVHEPTSPPSETPTPSQTPTPTEPPTPTPTEPPTPTPTETPTVTPDPTERTPTETPGTVPGFGPVAALVALALVLAVAGRRRR